MSLPDDPADVEQSLDFIRSADAHIMGRVAYEGIAAAQQAAPDHPAHAILTPARKVVFSPDPEDSRLGEHHHRRW